MRKPSARGLVSLAFFVAFPAVSLAFVLACSSSTPDPVVAADAAPEAEPVVPVAPDDAAPPTCKLTAKMLTGVAVCDDCLKPNCCQVLAGCFGQAGCTALNDCLNSCRDRLGTTDAGAQCARTCAEGKDNDAKLLTDALDCELKRCGTQCK